MWHTDTPMHPSNFSRAQARRVPVPHKSMSVQTDAKTEMVRRSLWAGAQRDKLSSHIAIAGDGVHGEAERAAPGQQAAGGWRDVPGNPVALKDRSYMPVAGQHVADAEPVQDREFARAIRLVDGPVRFGVGRHIVAARGRNVLNADDDSAAPVIGVIIMEALRLAAVAKAPPVAVTVIGSAARRLLAEPGKHFVAFSLGRYRQRLRRLRVEVVKIAEELGIDHHEGDALHLKTIVVRAKNLSIARDVISMNVVVARSVVHRRVQPLQDAASDKPLVVVFADIAANDDCVGVAGIYHVYSTPEIVESMRRTGFAEMRVTDLGNHNLRICAHGQDEHKDENEIEERNFCAPKYSAHKFFS
jgi:hypothetical protein